MRTSFRFVGIAALLLATTAIGHAQEKVWKHGILEAKADSGFIGMVATGDFAKKYGLKVELTQIKAGATLMKALIAGEIDSVDMGAAEEIVAAARGTGVKIVGCTWPGMPQVVLAKDTIKTPQELKGHTVAISSPGSLPDLVFKGMLQEKKIPVSDVKMAVQGADLDRYKSLISGITEAAVVSNEFVPVMPKDVHVLMKAGDVVPKFLRLCLATNAGVLKNKRDDLVKFVAAEMAAYKYAASNPDAAVKLAHEMTHTGADDKRAAFIVDQALKEKQTDASLSIPSDRIEWMEELFKTANVIPNVLPVSDLVDQTVRDDAAKLASQTAK
jgi:NitT/TauT family transport system substrate-binding protein